ncbi:MAG: PilZ domain-containing protein [Candidatus Zixiibacteriota bacterium]
MDMQRKTPRSRPRSYLGVFDRETDKLLGGLADLTADGIMLFGDTAFQVNQTCDVRLTLPKAILECREIVFSVSCVWCRRSVDTVLYHTGFKIIDITEEEKGKITRLLNHSLFTEAAVK